MERTSKTSKRPKPLETYDFTLKAYRGNELITSDELMEFVNEYCKEWAFQLERGKENGHAHYQGRVKLKEKKMLWPLINEWQKEYPGIRMSITSNNGKDNINYVTKEETRVNGPWVSVTWNGLVLR